MTRTARLRAQQLMRLRLANALLFLTVGRTSYRLPPRRVLTFQLVVRQGFPAGHPQGAIIAIRKEEIIVERKLRGIVLAAGEGLNMIAVSVRLMTVRVAHGGNACLNQNGLNT